MTIEASVAILDLLTRGIVIGFCSYLLIELLTRAGTKARHVCLCVGQIGCIATVFISLVPGRIGIELAGHSDISIFAGYVPPASWPHALIALYLGVAGLLLLRLLLQSQRLARMTSSLQPLSSSHEAVLKKAANEAGLHVPRSGYLRVSMAFATGVRKPTIVLPMESELWDDETLRAVVSHEIEHLRGRDPLALCFARCLVASTWFNPFSWLLLAKLRLEREFICDSVAAAAIRSKPRYAEMLIRLSSASPSLACAMSDGSWRVKERVRHLVGPSPSYLSKVLVVSTSLSLIALTLSVCLLRFVVSREAVIATSRVADEKYVLNGEVAAQGDRAEEVFRRTGKVYGNTMSLRYWKPIAPNRLERRPRPLTDAELREAAEEAERVLGH